MMRYFLNPVIAMFYNVAAQTWHPGLFEEKPLPGGDSPDRIVRHKSVMHHTGGFKNWLEAKDNIINDLVPKLKEHCGGCENIRVFPEVIFAWDGSDIPATVVMGDFSEAERSKNRKQAEDFLGQKALLDILGKGDF